MPDATHSQLLDWFSCPYVPTMQTLTPLKSYKTEVLETVDGAVLCGDGHGCALNRPMYGRWQLHVNHSTGGPSSTHSCALWSWPDPWSLHHLDTTRWPP